MGEFLMGKEVSGTPKETRKGSAQFADLLQNLMNGKGGSQMRGMTAPFAGLTTDALMSLFGDIGAGDVARDLLRNPADRTRGLFASMEPFERELTDRSVAETRGIFGTMGGRFGRNVAEGEASVRSKLGSEFGRNRETALLEANNQRGNVLMGLLTQANQSAQNSLGGFQTMAQFLQPGAPQQTGGLLPGLLSTAVNLYGMQQMGKGRQQPTSRMPAPGQPVRWNGGYFG